MDDKALQIIKEAEREKTKAEPMMNLYQQFADLGYPTENQITSKKTLGEDKSLEIRDPTQIFALNKATSGFIGAWIPRERFFFGIKVKNREIAELDSVKRYCALATQIVHDELFESNYITQLQNTVKSCIGFGTGNSYCEWSYKVNKLVFRDWHVSYYSFKENDDEMADTMILQYNRTARQLADKFNDPGTDVEKAIEKLETESLIFPVIHIVRPRYKRNYKLISKLDMPFESVFVNVKEKKVMKEGGYEEFPFAVPRWETTSGEKWGRGCGLTMLSAIKELQQMRKDYMESANRWNHSPYAVLSNAVEGEVNMKPDGRTDVLEKGAIEPIHPQLMGNFPITEKTLEDQRKLIKEGFYSDIFTQFGNLTGDRRTTTEIELRYKEGLRQLVNPVSKFEAEDFTPQLTRVIRELIRWGIIPPPPSELRGQEFGIEYMGELSMAMRDLQARGFERGMMLMSNMAATFPDVRDEINLDRTMPDILLNYGMKVEHLNTQEEKSEIRQQRIQEQQKLELAQAAQLASQSYKDTTKAGEEGSPAGALIGAMK